MIIIRRQLLNDLYIRKEGNNMKRLMIIFLVFIFNIIPVSADMGPKPSIQINIKDIREEAYITLLSSQKGSGPFVVYENKESYNFNVDYGPKEVWQAFVDYNDDFYFLQYFQKCEDVFNWTYYPPDEFKILIYYPKTNTFIISENSYERYAFDSYFTISIKDDQMIVETQEIQLYIQFIIRLIITIFVETLIALLMLHIHSKKELSVLIFINIFTQILLNILLNFIKISMLVYLSFIFYILIEIFIIWIERKFYIKYLNTYEKKEITHYTVLANIITFMISII